MGTPIADLMRDLHAKGADFEVIIAAVEAMERPKRKPSTSAKGTRLPPDWQLPRPWGEWAMLELGMKPDAIRHEAGKFHDYWIAKTGPNATKLDWAATWRNWAKKAIERQRPMDNRPLSAIDRRREELRRRLGNDERFGGRERDDAPEILGRLPLLGPPH